MSQSRRRQPLHHNIPIRTDLGTKLRSILRNQQPLPRVLQSTDFSTLEKLTRLGDVSDSDDN